MVISDRDPPAGSSASCACRPFSLKTLRAMPVPPLLVSSGIPETSVLFGRVQERTHLLILHTRTCFWYHTGMAPRSRDSVDRSPSSESHVHVLGVPRDVPRQRSVPGLPQGAASSPDGTECPKCGKASKFHRITGRSAYSCQYCGHHSYPTAGTIFHKSTSAFSSGFSRSTCCLRRAAGSAKQLEREIGVTYKTAHRMFKQIRTLLSTKTSRRWAATWRLTSRSTVASRGLPRSATSEGRCGPSTGRTRRDGRAQRPGPRPDHRCRKPPTLDKAVKSHVLPESILVTDDYRAYQPIPPYQGLRRSGGSTTARRSTWTATPTRTRSRGSSGSSRTRPRNASLDHVAYLQNYLDEHTFRYNRRNSGRRCSGQMLNRVAREPRAAS